VTDIFSIPIKKYIFVSFVAIFVGKNLKFVSVCTKKRNKKCIISIMDEVEVVSDLKLSFENTNAYFLLSSNSIAVCSFPGFICFGPFNTHGLLKNSTFVFELFDIHHLFSCLVQIVSILATEDENQTKLLFDEVHVLKDQKILGNYFWSPKKVLINDVFKVAIKIGIEQNDVVTYSFYLELEDLQNFSFSLKNVIMSSFCFTEKVFNLTQKLLHLDIEVLVKLDDRDELQKVLKSDSNYQTYVDFQQSYDFVFYYFELILIVKKLNLLQYESHRLDIKNMLKRSLM
jgi:hypothetical protein